VQTIIKSYLLPIGDVADFFKAHFTKVHDFNEKESATLVEKNLLPELSKFKKNIWAMVEYPYVDRMYRDTFYHFYASKLKSFDRDTVRISFFDSEINEEMFRHSKHLEELRSKYLGFLIVRPTFPKVVGRSSLSPAILEKSGFACCISPVQATVNHVKFQVNAFPHASQDGQFITCAETTIWSMLEYFGNKYPDYRPLLPSTIHELLKKFSYKRQLPSEGLTAEQIAYVVREVGFGAMFYSKARHGDVFDSVLSTFVESGIPVIGVISTADNNGHAVNIVGRAVVPAAKVLDNPVFETDTGDLRLIDFHKVKRDFVFIDDNMPPYQLASLDSPCKHYPLEKWKSAQLKNIIVPLYHRIYLDPIRARNNFVGFMRKIKLAYPDDVLVLRIFLASSRSYKEYLALAEDLHPDTKQAVLERVMPKFIWVAELSRPAVYEQERVEGVLIQDATEPSDYGDQSQLADIPVFCGWFENKFFSNYSRKVEFLNTFASNFPFYSGNLFQPV